MSRPKKQRPAWQTLRILNRHYRRTGLYDLVLAKTAAVLAAIVLLVGLYLAARPSLLAYQSELQLFLRNELDPPYVFALFYVSESLLGLLPPDLFMLWARARFPDAPYLYVTVLAAISYLGGITAYAIGSRIEHVPPVHRYIFDRHADQVAFMRQWGGAFILIAALLPIPFAIASTIAGLVEYPFRAYMLYGLARFLRFYAYAPIIFSVI